MPFTDLARGSWMINKPMGSEKAANKAPHLRWSEQHPEKEIVWRWLCHLNGAIMCHLLISTNYRSIWGTQQKSDAKSDWHHENPWAHTETRHTPEAIHKAINSWEPAPGRIWNLEERRHKSPVIKVPFHKKHLMYITICVCLCVCARAQVQSQLVLVLIRFLGPLVIGSRWETCGSDEGLKEQPSL